MSPRDKLIASMIIEGKSRLEVAEHLGCSVRAVEQRLISIYRRLGLTGDPGVNRRQALADALKDNPEALPTWRNEAGPRVPVHPGQERSRDSPRWRPDKYPDYTTPTARKMRETPGGRMSLIDTMVEQSLAAAEHTHKTQVMVNALTQTCQEFVQIAGEAGMEVWARLGEGIKERAEEANNYLSTVHQTLQELTEATVALKEGGSL